MTSRNIYLHGISVSQTRANDSQKTISQPFHEFNDAARIDPFDLNKVCVSTPLNETCESLKRFI